MPYKTLLYLLLTITISSASAQTWDKDYSLPVPSGNSSYLLCYDYSVAYGGLLCYSTMDSASYPLISDYYIVRISNLGDTLWTKLDYFDTLGYRSEVMSIAQLSDGSYILGTCLTETTTQWYYDEGKMFYRLDSNGNKTNVIARGLDNADAEDMKVMKTDHGGYYLSYSVDSVYYTSLTSTSTVAQSYIERYDSNNVLLWSKEFRTAASSGANPPYTDLYSTRLADEGVIYFTRDKKGKINSDGSTAYEMDNAGIIPPTGSYFQIFSTSDTGAVINFIDTAEHVYKFNASGALDHRIDLAPFLVGLQLWSGAELKKDEYIFVSNLTPNWGFCTYDKDLNFLDSIPSPFRQTLNLRYAPVSSGVADYFCALLGSNPNKP